MTWTRRAPLLLPLVALASCAGELEGGPSRYRVDSTEVGCATDLFAEKCANAYCHDSSDPTGGLDLASFGYRDRLVDVAPSDPDCKDRKLIDPVHSERSFLLEKLEKSAPQCGDQMPLSGEPPSPDELACVREWVNALVGNDGGSPGLTYPDSGAPADAATADSTAGDGGAP